MNLKGHLTSPPSDAGMNVGEEEERKEEAMEHDHVVPLLYAKPGIEIRERTRGGQTQRGGRNEAIVIRGHMGHRPLHVQVARCLPPQESRERKATMLVFSAHPGRWFHIHPMREETLACGATDRRDLDPPPTRTRRPQTQHARFPGSRSRPAAPPNL